MTTYTLILTEEQAEILGYALTIAKRLRTADASRLEEAGKKFGALVAQEHVNRIEDVRELLDRCPTNAGERT